MNSKNLDIKTISMEIENNYSGFVSMWQQLEATRQLLAGQSKRFCVRNVLRSWFPRGALPRPRGEEMSFDDLVWNVCRVASPSGEIQGWTELPAPGIDPRPARDFLRALSQVALGIGARQVKLKELDGAYKGKKRINVAKKREDPSRPPEGGG